MPLPPVSVAAKVKAAELVALRLEGWLVIATTGFVLSTLTVYDAVPVMPATFAQVAVSVSVPSPLDVLVVVQWPGSIAASAPDQCQVTTTSVLFQPFAFGAGAWVGAATGAVATTVIVKPWLVALPAASVEVHVPAVAPVGNVEPGAGRQVTGSVPSTASVAVGTAYVATAPPGPVAGITWLAGAVKAGPVVSTTVTMNCVCVAWLPAASTASHRTVVLPRANRLPGAGTQVAMPAPSTSSLVTGAAYGTVAPVGPVASAVTSPCGAMTGAAVSTVTVTVNGWVVVLPAASVDVHVTVVAPIGNVEPEAGVQSTGSVPSTASVAAGAVQEATAPDGPVAGIDRSAGTVKAGPVVSTTLT